VFSYIDGDCVLEYMNLTLIIDNVVYIYAFES